MSRQLVVDGSTHPVYEHGIFESDPKLDIYPPFVVFDIDLQEVVSAEFNTREEAQRCLAFMRSAT